MSYYDQAGYDIRFDWGGEGVEALASLSDIVIIVDVLSFSTCVDVAVSRGATVYPFGWKDERAEAHAVKHNAILARRRGEDGYSLSPPSLAALPPYARIVLPSPNGSTLTVAAAKHASTYAGSLRNRTAVAEHANRTGGIVTVIACGERWPFDDRLRPAIEDQMGAGAIIQKLEGTRSPEAESALAVFAATEAGLGETLNRCASGRELIEKGYPDDVAFAAELDVSRAVPLLTNNAYHDVEDRSHPLVELDS